MERFIVVIIIGIGLKMNSSAVKIVKFHRNYSFAAVVVVIQAL